MYSSYRQVKDYTMGTYTLCSSTTICSVSLLLIDGFSVFIGLDYCTSESIGKGGVVLLSTAYPYCFRNRALHKYLCIHRWNALD